MKLIHYSDKEFELEPRDYDQSELSWQSKPNGFWVSVEGEFNWKEWCVGESCNLENLVVCYEVIIKRKANILYLKTVEDIINFTKEYPYLKEQWNDLVGRRICASYELNWNKVKEKYQGIVITPYQWECRLSSECSWYYGWDCASGCIWDLSCIKELKLRETNECNRQHSCMG